MPALLAKRRHKKRLSLSRLGLPIFIELMLRNSTVLIVTFMVSIYAGSLVPALGAGNEVFELVIIIFSFITMGCSVVLAQALGAKKTKLASSIIHQSLMLNALLGALCASIVYLGSGYLLHLLNTPDILLASSKSYLELMSLGLFIDALCMILVAILRVYDLAYLTLISCCIMDVVTLFATYYALDVAKSGILGVGFALVLGRGFNLVCLLVAFRLYVPSRLYIERIFALHKDIVKKLLSVGLFSGGEYLVWGVQYIIAFAFIGLLGSDAIGVQTIFFQISVLMMLSAVAISQANGIIVGKLIGAKRLRVAYAHTWFALALCTLASLVVTLSVYFARDIIMDALDLSPSYRGLMVPLFFISIFLEFARCFNILVINALDAAGDVKFPFYMALIFMVGVSLPLGYYLCFHAGFGLLGIWIGFLVDESLRGLIHAWRWYSHAWVGKELV